MTADEPVGGVDTIGVMEENVKNNHGDTDIVQIYQAFWWSGSEPRAKSFKGRREDTAR